jgi:hypothetical protein
MLISVKELIVFLKILMAQKDSVVPMTAFAKASWWTWQQGHSSLHLHVRLLICQRLTIDDA